MNRLALALALVVAGCCPVERLYVEADRATFDAVAPEYLDLVDESSELDDRQKERRHDTIRSWEARLVQAEGTAE